ncbi:unnamed protein product [Trifolium pratense]|uniref:Uncharacterized protein n=1 Tax=Trifolium pratense TaxID=57577 RepID=A0ACB0LZ50_TRIPR|nr:unnamed protein product [Trifolium pratense]
MSFRKGPSFRIIIVQDQKTYKIPKLYREKYWKGTPNPIILKLPNGYEQEMSWVERNGEILFQKNWKTFSKDLNLSHGCVLTFKYIGGSHFKVKVFGPKCLEINYSDIRSENEDVVEAKEIIEEVSDEIPMQAQRKRNGKRKFQGRNRGNMVKKVKKYPTNEDVNVENPFFEVVMTNFYVKGCFLWIQSQFSREQLNNFRGIATLRVGKDTPMEVKIRFDDNYKKAMMCAGWKLFSKKYNLQVDDVCKFVMTQRRPPSFIVIINRARKRSSPKNLQGISCDNDIAKRRYIRGASWGRPRVYYVEDSESGIMVKHFKFKIYVKDDYNYPSLPMEFMNIVGCDKNVNVELKMGRRSWFVKVNYFDSMKSSRFGKGWRSFIQECNLIGEICSFNLIDEINLVFNVSVVRKNH